MIIKTRKDIADYVEKSPAFLEMKEEFGDEAEDIKMHAVSLIAGDMDTCPEFGEDWGTWLEENVEEMVQEAVSIVM
jgi:hypothetical protein